MTPIVITAEALGRDLADFGSYRKTTVTRAVRMDQAFVVNTTEGVMEGRPGDWLCLDAKGNPYPCAADVFEASYEPAP